jgi:hypothetical protein
LRAQLTAALETLDPDTPAGEEPAVEEPAVEQPVSQEPVSQEPHAEEPGLSWHSPPEVPAPQTEKNAEAA